MHYLTSVYKMCFVKCEKLFKFVFIEVRLTSMMRAPSPHALRLRLTPCASCFRSLCASVRLALFKTKDMGTKHQFQPFLCLRDSLTNTESCARPYSFWYCLVLAW